MDDFQKERMLKDPKERAKLQEEIEARQKEIGVRGMVGLRGQNEFQILEDLKNNSSKIEDTMLQAEENRQRREKPKKEEERRCRMKMAPEVYFRMKERQEREAYERRKITLR